MKNVKIEGLFLLGEVTAQSRRGADHYCGGHTPSKAMIG